MLPRADFMDETQALRQQLQQWQLALYRAVQMSQFKAGFLARTAHELRSPLASLMGLHQLVLNDLCENREEEREFIAQAHSAAQRLMNLLDEVVAIAKADYGLQPPQCQKILLAELLKDLEDSTHLLLANRNYHLHILAAANIWVWGDRNWLQQALLMLVDTAIVYGQTEHMTLTVTVNQSQAIVDLDLGCPQAAWSEPNDLLGQDLPPLDLRPLAQTWDFSPGMKLLLAQHLLEAMNARLALVEPDNSETSPALTRLRLCLPRA